MKNDDFKLLGCFAFWLTDGWTLVIVEWLLQLKKKTFNQNCECCCQFSVFEATNRASYDDHLTNLVSATANFCFLGPLAELAKIVTSWNMTNSTNNLVQKFKVNPSKIVSATANFLFLRPLTELAMMLTSINVPNATQNLLQKCQVNPTKFVRPLAELAIIVTS